MTIPEPGSGALAPRSEAGAAAVAAAERLVPRFAERAEKYDRTGSFVFENVADLRAEGLLRATVPAELGGLGIASLYDLAVLVERIARGDASTAIAANMHLAVVSAFAREWRAREASGEGGAPLRSLLERVASGGLTLSVLSSESGTSFLETRTEGVPAEGGWRINGRKLFGTLSPAADLFVVSVRLRAPGSEDRLAFAYVPRATEGLTVLDNWDALGMRGSGSNDVVLRDCLVPAPLVLDLGAWGRWNPRLLAGRAAGNVGLLGAFLGIAEAAACIAREAGARATDARKAPAIRQHVGSIEIELATSRALLTRAAETLDRHLGVSDPAPLASAHAAMKEFQCAKWVVNRSAVEIVDRAMTLVGGRAYAASHPLSRLYRDVRAGPFMQPFAPLEALDYIGSVALGCAEVEPIPKGPESSGR